jgi:NAD(P) transhydrogenase subunit alpha
MGGNCEKTVPGEAIDVNGVTVIGYTDLPSRMSQQASTLYATNIVNLLEEMGGAAHFTVDEQNDIVRPMTVVKAGQLMWPPPKMAPPAANPAAPAAAKPASAPTAPATAAAKKTPPKKGAHGSSHGAAAAPASATGTWVAVAIAGAVLFGIGLGAPSNFLTHFTVFVLACFVGYHVVWSVTPALHTPLMSVTNAISGIIVLGGMLQITGGSGSAAEILGLVSIFVATINISGGFLVTHRMLKMFRR